MCCALLSHDAALHVAFPWACGADEALESCMPQASFRPRTHPVALPPRACAPANPAARSTAHPPKYMSRYDLELCSSPGTGRKQTAAGETRGGGVQVRERSRGHGRLSGVGAHRGAARR